MTTNKRGYYHYYYYYFYFLKFYANPLPSFIPRSLNLHNRQVDDCVAGEGEILIQWGRWRWRQRRWRGTLELTCPSVVKKIIMNRNPTTATTTTQ